ncbi:hypothetical protein [Tenacibaculum sp. 190524A05c]|uniref:hypothetical protein n=1 Tax=Tenacibaculum platacis TaxID=3137852 RepID=UPI0032B26B27
MKKEITYLLLILGLQIFSQNTQTVRLELVSFSDKSYNDFAPTLFKKGILFVSDRDKSTNYYSLYYSDFKSKPKKVKIKNQKYHIGQIFYDALNRTAYLTKTSNEISKDSTTYNLAVFSVKIKGNKRKRIEKLRKLDFCNPNYSYGYAQIHNKKLTIHSNENNEYSLSVYESKNNKWVKEKVIYKDKYPILNPTYKNNSTIVFASKRPGGKGGVDLYEIVKINEKWGEPNNLKEFNSEYDELSLLYVNENKGYLSSNRIDNKDHIFKFTINQKE